MTSIVGVLNKHAVAIGADSAVTLGNTHKVMNSGNKIFTLSKYHPVGIMTYNAADFMGVPWEIIIKQYRKQLGDKPKEHISDYINDFISYVSSRKYLLTEGVQHKALFNQLFFFYNYCFDRAWHKAKNQGLPFDVADSNTVAMVKEEMEKLKQTSLTNGICDGFKDYSIEAFRTYAQKDFDRFFLPNSIPIPMIISVNNRGWFEEMFFNYIRSKFAVNAFTGLVFTGYGEEDIYPTIMALKICLFVDGRLKFFIEDDRTCSITDENDACIAPFAQDDVIQTIMGGMYPGFTKIIERVVRDSVISYTNNVKKLAQSTPQFVGFVNVLNKFNIDVFVDRMNKSIKGLMFDNYTKNLIQTVANLGKEDMANMAESFISLTSLVRRMSPHEETVGGPVDVAVISKGDGFIWINRKHYFKPEFNPQFFDNYYNK
jgi:hypothetical protein